MVVLRIAAHERQMHARSPFALIGHHQAKDLGIEALHIRAIIHIDAHVGQSRVDIRHGAFLLLPPRTGSRSAQASVPPYWPCFYGPAQYAMLFLRWKVV